MYMIHVVWSRESQVTCGSGRRLAGATTQRKTLNTMIYEDIWLNILFIIIRKTRTIGRKILRLNVYYLMPFLRYQIFFFSLFLDTTTDIFLLALCTCNHSSVILTLSCFFFCCCSYFRRSRMSCKGRSQLSTCSWWPGYSENSRGRRGMKKEEGRRLLPTTCIIMS